MFLGNGQDESVPGITAESDPAAWNPFGINTEARTGRTGTPVPHSLRRLRKSAQTGEDSEQGDALATLPEANAFADGEDTQPPIDAVCFTTTKEFNELQLLRGIPMNRLLTSFGSVFSEQEHTHAMLQADPYQIYVVGGAWQRSPSSQVNVLDIFLSHNWCVSYLRKFISMILYFNVTAATIAAAVAGVLCFFLQCTQVLPLVAIDTSWLARSLFEQGDLADAKIGCFGQFITVPVFMLTLVFKHVLVMCNVIRPGPFTFLDRVCIHQKNAQLKQAGCKKLGAVLIKSQSMLILYSGHYLQRLWTVYELTCFVMSRQEPNIQVLHVEDSVVCIQVIVGVWCVHVLGFMARMCFTWVGVRFPMHLLLNVPIVLALALSQLRHTRKRLRSKAEALDSLKHFQIKHAKCHFEADRTLLEGNIEAFLKCQGFLSLDASHEAALETFDRIVRRLVPETFAKAVGDEALHVKHVVLISAISFVPSILDLLSGVAATYGLTDVRVWGCLLWTFTSTMAVVPLFIEPGGWFMMRDLHLVGWKEDMHLLRVTLLLVVGFLAATVAPLAILFPLAKASTIAAIFLVFFYVLNMVGFAAYKRYYDQRCTVNMAKGKASRQKVATRLRVASTFNDQVWSKYRSPLIACLSSTSSRSTSSRNSSGSAHSNRSARSSGSQTAQDGTQPVASTLGHQSIPGSMGDPSSGFQSVHAGSRAIFAEHTPPGIHHDVTPASTPADDDARSVCSDTVPQEAMGSWPIDDDPSRGLQAMHSSASPDLIADPMPEGLRCREMTSTSSPEEDASQVEPSVL